LFFIRHVEPAFSRLQIEATVKIKPLLNPHMTYNVVVELEYLVEISRFLGGSGVPAKEVVMGAAKIGSKTDKGLDLNPSGRLISRLVSWNVLLTVAEPLTRFFEHAERLFGAYVKKGQAAVDLGCGIGSYTLYLAEAVGPAGKVYAVDSDKKNIRALEKRAAKGNYRNVEARASSAADLSFIADRSVDFVLANGLY
jgi:SAM-dependent methyltransferase